MRREWMPHAPERVVADGPKEPARSLIARDPARLLGLVLSLLVAVMGLGAAPTLAQDGSEGGVALVDCEGSLEALTSGSPGSSETVACAPEPTPAAGAPDEAGGDALGDVVNALLGGLGWLFGGSSGPEPTPTPAALPLVVPDVRDLPAAEAFDLIRSAGLRVAELRTQPDLDVEAGAAIGTVPSGGVVLSPGGSVVLITSTGPAIVVVPDVVGEFADDAETILGDVGLELFVYDGIESEEPVDTVLSQDPDVGSFVQQGSSVDAVVSIGLPTVAVPDLTGRRAANAVARLGGFDLAFGAVINRNDPEIRSGRVIRTRPPAGTDVELGTPVTLIVSRGPAPILVPDVLSLRRGLARRQLEEAGLKLGQVRIVESTEPGNTVLATDPPAGVQVRAGSEVGLTVSGGAASVSVPAVKGLRPDTAFDRLNGMGLVVTEVRYRTNAVVERGRGVKTDPGEAAEVAVGSPIVLTFSRGPRDELTTAPVSVPNVRDLPTGEAVAALIDRGLAISDLDPRNHARVAFGSATRTEPPAGTELPTGSSVKLITSLGPKPQGEVRVPNVRGRKAADALARLERDGLSVGQIQNQAHPNIPAGFAIRTSPARGASVELGTSGASLVMFVSTGPEPSIVPDVVGLRRRAARNELTSAGLKLGNVSFAASDAPSNTVIATDPPAGVERPAGASVNLTISAGGSG